MVMIVDTREPDALADLVELCGADVEREPLPAGDYHAGKYLVERKEWSDMAGRLLSGTLFEQVDVLVKVADEADLEPVYVAEGARDLEHTTLGDNDELTAALARIVQMGASVVPTAGAAATARFVAVLDRDAPDDTGRSVRAPPDEPDDPRSVAKHVLMGVPGIGPSMADVLLDEFGTVAGIAGADEDELLGIDGVGPTTASTVYDAMNES